MEKDQAVSRALFELRCIGEFLEALGNSLTEDSPHPWMCWIGNQVDRVASELEVGMMEKEGQGPAH
jgi:hypothetical protein